ncbi:MAG: glutamine synthetase III, partial [Candidatus Riflemargulisbacteria bacterium]
MSQIMNRFGELVFTQEVMRNRLSETVYSQLINTIVKGDMLEKEIAGEVAHSMKEWAIENGATHYTHWFQPLRGGTAEKHNSFISYDEEGVLIERLSAIQLIQSEPDASSFPSGGMRSTFEARGYSAWDPTSPVFLIEAKDTKTLVIPSVFLSWTGDVLDQKTGLLRSKQGLNNVGIKFQKLLGNRNAKRINVWLGIEQEYFLVDKELYETRADLQICKETLFGKPAARNQQLKDHYFGTIKKRVLIFMEDFDRE